MAAARTAGTPIPRSASSTPLWQLELDATDDALILLDQVTNVLLSQATSEHRDRRYKQLPELDRAARALRAAILVLIDPPPGGIEELWSTIAVHVTRRELELAPTRWTGSPRSPTYRTDGTRSARSCCVGTRASRASYRSGSMPSRSRPCPEDKRSSRRRVARGAGGPRGPRQHRDGVAEGRRPPVATTRSGQPAVRGERGRPARICLLRVGGAGGAEPRRRVRFPLRPFTDPPAKLLQGPAATAARPEICVGLSLDHAPQRARDRLGA